VFTSSATPRANEAAAIIYSDPSSEKKILSK